jgi:branched-chain amino acid transport system ATP-binding protein
MPAMLELENVRAGYGRIEVLKGITLAVPEGSVVALLGPNGAGKTTTLRAISGTLPVRKGAIRLAGAASTTAGRASSPGAASCSSPRAVACSAA